MKFTVGDRAIRQWNGAWDLLEVTKVSATRVTTVDTRGSVQSYSLRSGVRIGDATLWYPARILEYTEGNIKALNTYRATRKMENIRRRIEQLAKDATLEQLEAAEKVLAS